MIDHVALNVRDLEAAKRFYAQALEPLGYSLGYSEDTFAGLGTGEGGHDFWLNRADETAPTHIAFRSLDRKTVDAFHAAALAAGGTDNGAPGLRPQYHETYYGAYVLDPDGHNVEAVCHSPA